MGVAQPKSGNSSWATTQDETITIDTLLMLLACFGDCRLLDLINEDHSLRDIVRPEGSCFCRCPDKTAHLPCHYCQLGPLDVFVRIHGDEGPFFKKRNLLVMSLSFPHNHGVPCLQ